jgi:glycosyltransferase involved in cell wall biosynthesis
MKVVLPFWDLSLYPRYRNQFVALRKYLSDLVIVHEGSEYSKYMLKRWSLEDNIRFTCIPFTSRWKRPYHYLEVVQEENPDLLYTLSGFFFELCTYYASIKSGIPSIMRLRGNDLLMREKTRGFVTLMFYKLIYRRIWSNYDMIIPICNRIKDDFEENYKLKNICDPVYNGYDHITFYLPNLSVKYDFGYVGRLNDDKNTDFLLEVIENTPNIRYCLVGENQGNYKIPCNANYIGFVNKKELKDVGYGSWKYTLLPSFYEGVPNAVLESYLCNTPVVVSDTALPYDISLFGYSVELDTKKWVNLLNILVRRNVVKSSAYRHYVMNNFTWDKFSYNMFMKFKEVLNEK